MHHRKNEIKKKIHVGMIFDFFFKKIIMGRNFLTICSSLFSLGHFLWVTKFNTIHQHNSSSSHFLRICIKYVYSNLNQIYINLYNSFNK